MKKNITKLEKINKTKKEKENNKTDTYYEKH
jgi:hypothetical protein